MEVEKPAPVTTIPGRRKTPNKIAKGLKSDDGSIAARITLLPTLRWGNQYTYPHNHPSVAPQPTHLAPLITTRKLPSPRGNTLIFDAPSRVAHRATDHHPTAEPEATRLMKRKFANLCSDDSTHPLDDSPSLMRMAGPIPDSSSSLLEKTYDCPTVEPESVCPMKQRKLADLELHGSTRTSDDRPPLMAHPVPELSDLLGLDVPACKRLISGSLSQQQVISLIKAIFASKDEVEMISNLRGDDTQAFVDVIYEVRSASWALSEAWSNHLPLLIRLSISRISNHHYEEVV